MNEQTLDIEISALWAEIAAAEPELDVDVALHVASAEVAALLQFAAKWDADVAAMQSTPVALAA